jgi:hypothetical protein
MVCFQTKNPNLGKFWRVLEWKMLVYFMDTWSILWSFVIFYGHLVYVVRGNLEYFSPFWYFVPRKIWQPWIIRTERTVRASSIFGSNIVKNQQPTNPVTFSLQTRAWRLLGRGAGPERREEAGVTPLAASNRALLQ